MIRIQLSNKITILGFTGTDVAGKKGNFFNLNQKIYEKYSKLKDDFVVWYLHLTCSNYIESIKTHGLMDADNLVESGIISNAETHKIGDSTYDEETQTIVDAESFDADSFFKDNGFTDVEKTNSMQILKRYGILEINTI